MTDLESRHNGQPLAAKRFPACDLSADPVPVQPLCLVEGSVYFRLSYLDSDKLVPILETIVYVGRDISTKDLLFQDIDSHQEGVRQGTQEGESYGTFVTRSIEQVADVFEYERAVEELMRCSRRRKRFLGLRQTPIKEG